MHFSVNELEEIRNELKVSYRQFFDFSISLLENLTETNNHLQFAVVNMQISLELFLKYYFVAIGEPEKIFTQKGKKKRYKDSSDVVSIYFSKNKKPYISKQYLNIICQKRNDIVHKGKVREWDEKLSEYIICCALFIQGTLKSEFDETIFSPAYFLHENKLSRNSIWINGASKFAEQLSSNLNFKVLNCIHCNSKAFVNKNDFNYDETGEGFQCLACFHDLDTENEARIIKCKSCEEDSYVVEALNQQPMQLHGGKCINCPERVDVRQCKGCEKYYFLSSQNEHIASDKYYCSKNCFWINSSSD